ncbi:beta-N-acetylhexosaminidase [Pseudomarimonas arenosa]|uniref:beta-N-acetylhexosaminidase n=1 Tax=Pseudomarimonas arenosa TaxID=2774145 RepID=A0AAW3ZIA2_9GAMM|nr:beta-N-acetylhexosaminidase [Pseudomarimonas arenosa]
MPRPAALTWLQGELPATAVNTVAAGQHAEAAHVLMRFADRLCGQRLQLAETGSSADIALLQAELGADAGEAYRLRIDSQGIQLQAANSAGMRYAALTAAQLLCWKQNASLPAMLIEDAPQFAWRGAMLDSARHFQSIGYIKRFLDAMALHKLNVFHWHLTDDQAWRLEIKRYPKLTEVGAWRVPAGAGQQDIDPATGEARRYGGFYTQADVAELIAYAADLGIQVVPEIDMPGHASAAIAAYPELAAVPGSVTEVPADWGIYQNLFTLEEHGFVFLQQVLDEVAALFPSPYLHVGGDEVQPDQWLASARGKQLLETLPGDDPHRLQAWFTERIARHVESRGKRLIGWDEILTPGLAPNAVVMSWRGIEGGIAAAKQGHDAVLSPWPTLYFDNQQSSAIDEPPGRLRSIDLATVYGFQALPPALNAEQRKRLLGIQGNLWTEHIRTERRVSHMGFPRLAAVAELGWSAAERRDFAQFRKRLKGFFAHYAAVGIGAANPFAAAEPSATPTAAPAPTPSLQRHSRELTLCTENIALGLEDDAPIHGPRAVFAVDIQNPCWRWPGIDLSQPMRLRARVGQVPFNFQIGAAKDAIRLAQPHYQGGELLVLAEHCEGEPLARLPLGSAARNDGVSTLASINLPVLGRDADLCFRFAQPTLDPLWVIEQVQLEPR